MVEYSRSKACDPFINKEKEKRREVKKMKKSLNTKPSAMKKKVIKKQRMIYNSDSDIDYEMIYKIGDNVIVRYEEEYFPGIINDTNAESALVSVMVMSGKGWNWPSDNDEIWYSFNDIMRCIKPPQMSIEDGVFYVPEITEYKK